jgi:HAD superfamily hydrolase (TIGR01662 family)
MFHADRKIKAVFFDLGYTLIYFDGDFSRIVEESYLVLANKLVEAGYVLDTSTFVAKFNEKMQAYYRQRELDLIERPVDKILKEILSEFKINTIPAAIYRAAMDEMYINTERHWQIEKETHATLQQLVDANYKLAIITNASDAWDVNNLIDNHGLRKYFDCVLISAEEGIRKPDTRIFAKAAQTLGVELEECVMVGDTLNADILGAHASGIKAVWVKRRKNELDTSSLSNKQLIPDAEIDSLEALLPILTIWQTL